MAAPLSSNVELLVSYTTCHQPCPPHRCRVSVFIGPPEECSSALTGMLDESFPEYAHPVMLELLAVSAHCTLTDWIVFQKYPLDV